MKTKSIFMNLGMTPGLILLALSLMTVNAFSQAPDPNFYIFLAFGQSNMEGYPSQQQHQDSVNVPARFKLLPAVDWPDKSRTKGTWTAAMPPMCRNSTGLCPCDYFGRTLADSLPATIKIGIINVAVAGCAIEMFDKDKYQTYVAGQADWLKAIATGYGGSPYARLVEMGKAAQKDGVIKGFLLHQGESGSSTGQWANEVKKIYFDLIKDLSLDSTATPLLVGDLTGSGSNDIKNIPKTLKYAHYVSSQGCTANSTGIHFDAAGYRELGIHFADTMLNVLKKLTGVAEGKAGAGYAMRNGVELKTGMASLSFEIPERAFVTLKAYTLGGRQIAELAGMEYAGGRHTLVFGRKALGTGVCVLKMHAGPFSATRTILVGAQ